MLAESLAACAHRPGARTCAGKLQKYEEKQISESNLKFLFSAFPKNQ